MISIFGMIHCTVNPHDFNYVELLDCVSSEQRNCYYIVCVANSNYVFHLLDIMITFLSNGGLMTFFYSGIIHTE